jgi:hypothetical protein
MISIDPVTKTTRFGSPKREVIAGESVMVQLNLMMKLATNMI